MTYQEALFPLEENTFIVGKCGAGKTTLIKKIIHTLKQESYLTTIISENRQEYDKGFMTIEDIVIALENYRKEMIQRLRDMEILDVPNGSQIFEKRFLIIDGYDSILIHDFHFTEKIRNLVGNILRLGKSANMFCIITSQTARETTVGIEMFKYSKNLIVVGLVSETMLQDLSILCESKLETQLTLGQAAIKKKDVFIPFDL